MTDDALRNEFARDFKRLIDAMNAGTFAEQTPLMKRLEAHLGGNPSTMPIVAEEFEAYEHPNVQVALDALFGPKSGRTVDLVGIAMQNKRWGQMTFSDLLASTGPWGRLAEGPVDYTNFELEGDRVISVAPEQFGVLSLVKFHKLPKIARDDIVLPEGALERVDRHAIAFSEHASALTKAGRSLHRGVLMYGPPGTGKTLTVMYLAGRMTGRTVILMSGPSMGWIGRIGQFVRDLAPATIVVEDVDMIAQERGLPGQQAHPLLFELMNQMDGLAEDIDVLFILTTNRPDILEPALAARPGRVDLAVELPVPDASGRARLLKLYARGLDLDGVRL